MKLLQRAGTAITLLSTILLSSCEKVDYVPLNHSDREPMPEKVLLDPENNELKTFSYVETKATMTPTWTEGDKLTVVSLADDGTILFMDVCQVYNINRNHAKITAEVAKNAARYYAVYPYDYLLQSEGDVLNDKASGYINYTGNFGDVSIMDAYCEVTGNAFNFREKFSLLRLDCVSQNFPLEYTIKYSDGRTLTGNSKSFGDTAYYIPIDQDACKVYSIVLKYRKRSITTYRQVTKTMYPKKVFYPANVYATDLNK